MEGPTKVFDHCGLYLSGNHTNYTLFSYAAPAEDGSLITIVMPSRMPAWQNAIGFFNDPVFKPPLFKGYEIVIEPDSDTCFNQGLKLAVTVLISFSEEVSKKSI